MAACEISFKTCFFPKKNDKNVKVIFLGSKLGNGALVTSDRFVKHMLLFTFKSDIELVSICLGLLDLEIRNVFLTHFDTQNWKEL